MVVFGSSIVINYFLMCRLELHWKNNCHYTFTLLKKYMIKWHKPCYQINFLMFFSNLVQTRCHQNQNVLFLPTKCIYLHLSQLYVIWVIHLMPWITHIHTEKKICTFFDGKQRKCLSIRNQNKKWRACCGRLGTLDYECRRWHIVTLYFFIFQNYGTIVNSNRCFFFLQEYILKP